MWKYYADCINGYEGLGEMQLVSGDNGNDGKETFYLTNYLVFQHHISNTKLRVIFNEYKKH